MTIRDLAAQHSAARAVTISLAATRGRELIAVLQYWYGGPWETCIPEDLIARALADLRSAGFDVATAADSDEVRAASIDVPVRKRKEPDLGAVSSRERAEMDARAKERAR